MAITDEVSPVMDRHQARAHEASKIAHAMLDWLSQNQHIRIGLTSYTLPQAAAASASPKRHRRARPLVEGKQQSRLHRTRSFTPTCCELLHAPIMQGHQAHWKKR